MNNVFPDESISSLSDIEEVPRFEVEGGSERSVVLSTGFKPDDTWEASSPCREHEPGIRCIHLGLHAELSLFGSDVLGRNIELGTVRVDPQGWAGASVVDGGVLALL